MDGSESSTHTFILHVCCAVEVNKKDRIIMHGFFLQFISIVLFIMLQRRIRERIKRTKTKLDICIMGNVGNKCSLLLF